ncbi:hypothetical protein ACVW00_003066 [Marmoricola sp. URHA0025 HA25]
MLDTSDPAAATVDRWRAAAESSDVEAALACLSPDIVVTSPLTDQFRLEGTDQVRDFLAAAFTAVRGINFHTQTGQGNSYALAYRARVGSQPFEEAQLLVLNDTAHINQITLFGRPLPALTALMIALGPDLARRQGRRGLATLLRASATPIHVMVTSGDRTIVPRTRPRG